MVSSGCELGVVRYPEDVSRGVCGIITPGYPGVKSIRVQMYISDPH